MRHEYSYRLGQRSARLFNHRHFSLPCMTILFYRELSIGSVSFSGSGSLFDLPYAQSNADIKIYISLFEWNTISLIGNAMFNVGQNLIKFSLQNAIPLDWDTRSNRAYVNTETGFKLINQAREQDIYLPRYFPLSFYSRSIILFLLREANGAYMRVTWQ